MPAAAKAAAKATKVKKDGGDSSAKGAKGAKKEVNAKKSLGSYFQYWNGNKGKNEHLKAEALAMKKEYQSCSKEAACQFALKFMQTKGTGSFAWHKNFSETYQAKDTESQEVLEKYMARSIFSMPK